MTVCDLLSAGIRADRFNTYAQFTRRAFPEHPAQDIFGAEPNSSSVGCQ